MNPKLDVEFAAHVVGALLVLSSLKPWLVILSLPPILVRALWRHRKKLVVDSTTCFNASTQSGLQTRWAISLAWHILTIIFAFQQCLMHLMLSLGRHDGLREKMEQVGEMHRQHAEGLRFRAS